MNILALDTVSEACSVALKTHERCLHTVKVQANTHSKLILGMVDEVLAQSGLTLADIDLLAVDNGPGSFTGIRIGVGVAQGLAYAQDIPVVGINALAVLAAQSEQTELNTEQPILSIIDARMSQVYWAQFARHPLHLSAAELSTVELNLTGPEQVTLEADTAHLIYANSWANYAEHLAPALQAGQILDTYPAALEVANLAVKMDRDTYCSAAQLVPVYLRDQVASVSAKKRL